MNIHIGRWVLFPTHSHSLPLFYYLDQVVQTLGECNYVYDILFNTVEMQDPYKDTGHVGTNPDLQRSFWNAQAATLKWMWGSIRDRVLATVWADMDVDEFDTALPHEFVVATWYCFLIPNLILPPSTFIESWLRRLSLPSK